MSRVRPEAVAGLFYPAERARLRTAVESALGAAEPTSEPAPKALVVPHAGYEYSGPIAGSAYARLRGARAAIHRVVLLGPAHRVPVAGLATSGADQWATPLGLVPIDAALRATAEALPRVGRHDRAHDREHSLEVQLPFLQVALDDFTLLPLVVGEATPAEVAAVLEALWGGAETLVVVSSDLSHYRSYASACEIDRATAASIVALEPGRIDDDAACGAAPLRGLLAVARRRGLAVRLLDLRNSGDTAGDRESVVGYGAFAVA